MDNNSTTISKYDGGDAGRNQMMIFHKTNDHQNPGVGDYSISQITLDIKKQTPKSTIDR